MIEILGINGGKYGRGEMGNLIKYKKSWGSPLCCITLLSSFAICYNKKPNLFLFLDYHNAGSVAGQQWGCEGWRRHAEKDEDFSAAL